MTVIVYSRQPSHSDGHQVNVGLREQSYRQFGYVIKMISSQGINVASIIVLLEIHLFKFEQKEVPL